MSTHAINIVQIDEVLPHPDKETTKLAITKIYGWQAVIGKADFQPGSKAIYIPPDYVVPTDRPEFSFLARPGRTQERITVRRFRGQYSQGLVIPVPKNLESLPVGADVMEALGIIRYEPPEDLTTAGNFVKTPAGLYRPVFDVESVQRFPQIFYLGEPVILTEKIHGTNSAYVSFEGAQYCGSRKHWMAQDATSVYWKAFQNTPELQEWCATNPGVVVYGEVFGYVQKLRYGAKPGQVFFRAFAILNKNTWVDYQDPVWGTLPRVPEVKRLPFILNEVLEYAEGNSLIPGAEHIREGVVIQPEHERENPEIGRVVLKAVSNKYLEKA